MAKAPRVNSKICSVHGGSYYRVNKSRVWTIRNEGHRTGWHWEEVKVCTKCQSAKVSQRILVVAQLGTPPKEMLQIAAMKRNVNGK